MTETDTSQLSLEQGMRRWGAVLKLWRLCGHASCRRSRACRGDVDRCFAANFPLLPDGVRDFIDGLAEARARELSFEEARAWLDGTEACDAFRDWNAAVAASVMRYSPPLSKRR